MNPSDFEAFTRPFPDAFFLTTAGGTVRAANQAATRLTGRAADALTRLELWQLVDESEARVREFLRIAAGSGTMIPGRLTFRHDETMSQVCRCAGAAVRARGPEASPTLVVVQAKKRKRSDRFLVFNQQIDQLSREMRRRIELEEQRLELLESEKESRAEAEEANRVKDKFLATISHELRTPLNAIIGWASLLREGAVGPEEVDHAVRTIERAAKAQGQLIEDLLDYSRIMSGKLRLDVQPLNVTDVVETALETLRPMAEVKGVRLQPLLDPGAGPVSGDADRLQQVVWNLVSNAIKFTPEGGRVQVRVQRVNSHVEIIVSDTGRGIEPEVLPYIFDRFRQEARPGSTGAGVGLGLSIVKYLVELHGGLVYAESPGKSLGSTFTVTLPLVIFERPDTLADDATKEHPAAEVEVELDTPIRLDGVQVLVIEDDADSREMFRALFQRSGADVEAVRSAADAWTVLNRRLPDVIVSDIEMPGEDGYTFIRKLRARDEESGGRIPAVAVTAFSRTVDRLRTLQAGFQMQLAKPIEPSELVIVVASLLERAGPR